MTLFSGLLLNGILAESLSRAPTIIQANANYVKKLVFPLEILPLTPLLAAFFNAMLGYLVLCIFLLFSGVEPGWQLVLLPLALLPFLLCVDGAGRGSSRGSGSYVRDIGQFVQFLLVLLLIHQPGVLSAVILATGNAALPVPQSADDPGGNGQGDPFRCSLSDPWGLQRLLRCVSAGLFIGLPLVPSGSGRFCRCPLRPFPRARR